MSKHACTCIILKLSMKYKEKMPSASRELRWSTICTGTTQRDGMGREVGWGFGMGDTCTPVADSC